MNIIRNATNRKNIKCTIFTLSFLVAFSIYMIFSSNVFSYCMEQGVNFINTLANMFSSNDPDLIEIATRIYEGNTSLNDSTDRSTITWSDGDVYYSFAQGAFSSTTSGIGTLAHEFYHDITYSTTDYSDPWEWYENEYYAYTYGGMINDNCGGTSDFYDDVWGNKSTYGKHKYVYTRTKAKTGISKKEWTDYMKAKGY